MCDENIEIGVTEITNNILVSAQPTDQIIDINVLEEVENVELTITPSVVEVNIDVTQELITEIVTVDANTCVNIVDVTVTDATDNVTLNITPSLVEVNINRGENNLSIEEYESFADLPTIGDTDTYYITLDDNKFWRWDSIDEVYVEISDSNDKIPYLGAYKNSDLGEWGIKSNWFGLDLTPTNPPTVAGTITWNDTDGTADLILKGGNVTLQIGQEEVVRVVNKTGATLNEADFKAVRIRSVAEGGAQGQRLAVVLAQANNDANSATTIGLVTESISDNQEGFITTSGEVKKINTTGAKSYLGAETWVDGDILYLSPTHAGYLTNVKPQAPNHTIIIGWVVYAHANNGKIFVKVDNGYELDELHNVKITTPTNNQGLVYDSALSVWKNASIQLPLSATSPLSIASNVLSITKADATTDGYLSSTDWNYFSAKQQPLFGTGFVKATGSVISYDNTVYTPQSRTLTINGTAYDLSADRSWSISVGSGMRNVSSFVATAGQTTFTIVGGYTAGLVDVFVNGARLNSGDYTATNGTTVVLGTGVVANDIVDIINYTASLTSGLTGAGTANYITKWSGTSAITNSLIFDNGSSIGIGTSTPDIYSNIGTGLGVTMVASATNTSANLNIIGNGTGFGGISLGNSTIRRAGIFALDGSILAFYTNSSNSGTSLTERIRILSSGFVGIGTTTIGAPLTVLSDNSNAYTFNLLGRSADNASTINFFNNAGSTRYGFLYNDANGMYLGVNGSTRLQITTSGRLIQYSDGFVVGSGASNTVAGGSFLAVANAAQSNWVLQQLNASFGLDWWTYSVSAGWLQRMTLTQDGRLGIGTTAPNGMLHVAGRIYGTTTSTYTDFNSGGLISYGAGSTTKYIQMGYDTTGSYGWIQPLTTGVAYNNLVLNGAGGNVGIGTISPSYTLHVNGSVAGTSAYNNLSDKRFKKNIKPLSDSLNKVLKLNGISFDWNKEFDESINLDELNHIGLLAQEVEKIIPQSVFTANDKNKTKSVAYSDLVPVLIEAIKELNAKLEAK